MLGWASVILNLVKLADMLFQYVSNAQLMDAGVQKQLAKDFGNVVAKTSLFAKIDQQIAGDTDDDVLRSLREKFGRPDADDSGGKSEGAAAKHN